MSRLETQTEKRISVLVSKLKQHEEANKEIRQQLDQKK